MLDFRIRAVENGHRAAPILFVLINILHDLGKEAVGRLPDLVRRSLIDLESTWTREYRYYVVPNPMPDADTVDPLAAEMDRALQ